MNIEDRKSKQRSGIVEPKQTLSHAFEWPDDQQESAVGIASSAEWFRGEYVLNWGLFWSATWFGTAIAGALFGGVLGLFGGASQGDASIPLMALFFGGVWAGAVGLFVFVHLAAICWAFRGLSRPLLVSSIAGLLTGGICGMVFFSLATAPLGAAGAYLAGATYLKSPLGQELRTSIKDIRGQSLGSLRFTMMELLLRVTVLAVFLAGWTAWLRSF